MQWELELIFTKLDISIWCRCFLSIFDFYSDSRPHFRSESVQRFINCNKIGYFVHRRRVCKEQWELVLTFTKLDISIWCRCSLSIFDFDSDSRPHFHPESAQRFIYCNKIGNLWTDSDRKWGLESESKSKIERKHRHHIDIPN